MTIVKSCPDACFSGYYHIKYHTSSRVECFVIFKSSQRYMLWFNIGLFFHKKLYILLRVVCLSGTSTCVLIKGAGIVFFVLKLKSTPTSCRIQTSQTVKVHLPLNVFNLDIISWHDFLYFSEKII